MDLGDAEIVSDPAEPEAEAVIVGMALTTHFGGQNVSISLKYYQKKPECWSEWNKPDLKGFTKLIELLRAQSGPQLRGRGSGGTPPCKSHSGKPSTGFNRPSDISEDIQFYEFYVTHTARVHGFFVDPVFFLVWLDRSHRAFP
jgi:hypothetical protein